MRTKVTQLLALSCIFTVAQASAQAGSITSGGINSNVSGLGSVSNSVGVTVSPELVKFVGDIEFDAIFDGSTTGNTVTTSGGVTLDAGDAFSLAYDYNVSLVGTGTVTLTALATTDFGGVEEMLSSVEIITEPGDYNFTFTDLGVTATETLSGTWEGQLQIDWEGTTAGSSLIVSIPNDSIDFAITTVPEPSTLLLALFSTVLLARPRK